jgi:hypothetical protein
MRYTMTIRTHIEIRIFRILNHYFNKVNKVTWYLKLKKERYSDHS